MVLRALVKLIKGKFNILLPVEVYVLIFPLMVIVALSGCITVCGDVWDHSPRQLLDDSQYVLIGNYTGSTVLEQYGPIAKYDTVYTALVVEYRFEAERVIQGDRHEEIYYLWNFEWLMTGKAFKTWITYPYPESVLVCGNVIAIADSIVNIMSHIPGGKDILKYLRAEQISIKGKHWTTDSTIAAALNEAPGLKSLLTNRLDSGVVLYGKAGDLWTMNDYAHNRLCYYDSLNQGHSLSASEYLADLLKLSPARPSAGGP